MSIPHSLVLALVRWFGSTAAVCVTIDVVVSPTGAENASGVTEEFGTCFYAFSEDVGIWGMIQKNQLGLIITLILIVMAGHSLQLIVERFLTFAIARRQSIDYQLRVGSALFHGRFEEATALSAEYPKSHIAFAVEAFVRSNPSVLPRDAKPSLLEWQRSIVIKSAEIKRGLWMLGTIAWSAPLVGVLYASLRIAQTFEGWHAAAASGFAPYADEIAYSVMGVSFSIIVAVPSILAYKYFSAQADGIVLEMHHLSLAIIELLFNQQATAPSNSSSASYVTQGLNANLTGRITR